MKQADTNEHDTRTWPLLAGASWVGGAALFLTTALAPGCGRAGGKAETTGGFEPPLTVLEVDFALRRDIHLGSAFEGDVIGLDVNGDELIDYLVEANFGTQKITVATVGLDGTFSLLYEFDTPGHSWQVDVADVDGDGLQDIVVACRHYLGTGDPSVVAFLQGPNPGEFDQANQVCFSLPSSPRDVVSAPANLVAGTPGAEILFVSLPDTREIIMLGYNPAPGGRNCTGLEELGRLDSTSMSNGGGPFTMAIVDIAGDGNLDLAVGEIEVENDGDDRVILFKNDGQDFLPPTLVHEPVFGPVLENVGFANADTFEDIAVAQLESDHVLFFAGTGSGLDFTSAVFFEGPTSSVIFPDLNGDGLTDVAGTVLTESYVSVHIADGDFTWLEPVRYSVGYLPRALGLVHLNADTVPDLLCSNAQDLSVLWGLGQGLYRGSLGFPTLAPGPRVVKVADLDNDGDMDAVTAAAGSGAVSFLEGDGNGGLKTVTTVPIDPPPDESPIDLVLTDVDADGHIDVLVTIRQLNELRLLRNPGNVSGFSEPDPSDIFPTGNEPLGLDVGDFNDDGLMDAVVGLGDFQGVQVLLNQGGGELMAQSPIPTGIEPALIRCMDLDNDGFIDIAMTTGDIDGTTPQTDRLLVILSGSGTGTFAVETTLPIAANSVSLDFGDLDGNDFIDIVVAPTGVEHTDLRVAINRGGFAFTLEMLPIDVNPSNVLVADVDQDSALDLIVVTGLGELKFAFGDGAGNFPDIEPNLQGELPVLFDMLSVQYADMNGDELNDLVMVSHRSANVWVGLNASIPVEVE